MRILKSILCLSLLFALVVVPSWAEAPEIFEETCIAELYQEGFTSVPEVTAAASGNVEAAKAIILEALLRFDTVIDFSSQGVFQVQDIRTAYPAVINENPELFYVTGAYSYSYSGRDTITSVRPTYSMAVSEIPRARQLYAAELSRILDYASAGSTPLIQAMLVNDYFCLNYQYDTSYRNHDAYSLFTQKTGVCEAYMLGYKAALKALGIPVKTATSDPMDHTWNLVQIDGAWYHVDVTWNDPVPDQPGRAGHEFFLRSDAGFESNPYGKSHYSWVADDGITAVSTRFDNAVWCTVDSPAVAAGNDCYLIQGDENCQIISLSGNVVHNFSTTWYITTNGYTGSYRIGCFSRLGYYKNHLVYNTFDEVRAVSLKDSSVKKLYTAPSGLGIWEARFDGGVLHYGLGTDYNRITQRGDLKLELEGVVPVGDLLVIPAQTTVIAAEAFRGSNVRNLVGSEELQRIESLAFADCTSLETVQLGAEVTFIAEDAFQGCKNITFLCPTGSYAESYAKAQGFDVE